MDGKIENNQSKKPQRDKYGRFLPGNSVSKGNKSVKLDKKALIEAMQIVEKEKKIPFLVQTFKMAYKYPQVMNKVLDKFFADLSISELKNSSGMPFNLFITQYLQQEKQAKEEKVINPKPEDIEK